MKEFLKRVPSKNVIERNDYLISEINKMLSVSDCGFSCNNNDSIKLQEELQLLHKTYDFCDRVFEENGLKGLKDIKDQIRVPALYSDFLETYDYNNYRKYPVPALISNGKCLLVSADGSGKPLTSPVYDGIRLDIFSGFFIVERDNKKGVLNNKGVEIVPCDMDVIYGMSNGIMVIEKAGKLGLLTYTELYVAPEYNEVEEDEGVVRVCRGDEWGYIGEDGNFVSEQEFEDGKPVFISID